MESIGKSLKKIYSNLISKYIIFSWHGRFKTPYSQERRDDFISSPGHREAHKMGIPGEAVLTDSSSGYFLRTLEVNYCH